MSDEPTYPCADCGAPRTKAEGGTTFTVCDECWGKPKSDRIEEAAEALYHADSFPSPAPNGRKEAPFSKMSGDTCEEYRILARAAAPILQSDLLAENAALKARVKELEGLLCPHCRCRADHPQPCHCENDE